ncbi:hypothetical protein FTX61_06285 [Nitriliruptoraceae bacterium ZYF776]|nr:hypothetical protein [Profundirhabdus halotolerans]
MAAGRSRELAARPSAQEPGTGPRNVHTAPAAARWWRRHLGGVPGTCTRVGAGRRRVGAPSVGSEV